MTGRKYFTQTEAEALVGRRIRTTVPWSGVPQGCGGTVVRADRRGLAETGEEWTVGIQWDLPDRTWAGKPLVDWFSRDEYERWIEEVTT